MRSLGSAQCLAHSKGLKILLNDRRKRRKKEGKKRGKERTGEFLLESTLHVKPCGIYDKNRFICGERSEYQVRPFSYKQQKEREKEKLHRIIIIFF